MKAVILDGYTINPGDLSWEKLGDFAEYEVYERTPADLVIERSKDADMILTSKVLFTKEVLEQLPKLKYIGVLATGYNIIDTEEAAKRGIVVTNVPAYSTPSVAQMVFSLLFELCSHVQEHSDSVKGGQWSQCKDFCYWNYPVIELAEKTIGIIGFGKIGQQVGKIASALGMHVLVWSRTKKEMDTGYDYAWADTMEELLRSSDVVSLHCPLFPETRYLINEETLRMMKPTAFLINTSRGPLVHEAALAKALREEWIAGAGIDVMEMEPPQAEHPLYETGRCVITPHIAWASKEARKRLVDIVCENAQKFVEGHPVNVVNEMLWN